MTIYYVGYMDKPWKNSDFRILAETRCKGVAESIKCAYNESYENIGISVRLEIKTGPELPKEYSYSED